MQFGLNKNSIKFVQLNKKSRTTECPAIPGYEKPPTKNKSVVAVPLVKRIPYKYSVTQFKCPMNVVNNLSFSLFT